MHFKIDWVSLIVGSRFTVFASFFVIFEGKLPSTSHRAYIFGGAIGGFFALLDWGAYIWRGLLSVFYGSLHMKGKNAMCMC